MHNINNIKQNIAIIKNIKNTNPSIHNKTVNKWKGAWDHCCPQPKAWQNERDCFHSLQPNSGEHSFK